MDALSPNTIPPFLIFINSTAIYDSFLYPSKGLYCILPACIFNYRECDIIIKIPLQLSCRILLFWKKICTLDRFKFIKKISLFRRPIGEARLKWLQGRKSEHWVIFNRFFVIYILMIVMLNFYFYRSEFIIK